MATKTYYANPHTIQGQWYVMDAKDQVLGRFITKVATYLMGKHRPEFTPAVNMGDRVIVINADKIRVTGNKTTDKRYYRHTGYPGGIKDVTFDKLQATHPERIIELAVKGMLSKNSLGRDRYRNLHVYKGETHPHAAQQPEVLASAE